MEVELKEKREETMETIEGDIPNVKRDHEVKLSGDDDDDDENDECDASKRASWNQQAMEKVDPVLLMKVH